MAQKLRVVGERTLSGCVSINGAKNAALPLMCASLLTEEPLVLENLPQVADIFFMGKLLETLGGKVDVSSGKLHIQDIGSALAHYDLVSKMRASILVLGPLVARFKQAQVSLPGGCAIGPRPVDIHLQGLSQLGAIIEVQGGYIYAKAPHGLEGNIITLPKNTVTGTENLMMAACLAKGETRILNAAREPEIVDLAHCLRSMGAIIEGEGTDEICIQGVEALYGTRHSIIPDRIETGTYAIAAAITGGELLLEGANQDHLPGFFSALCQAGVCVLQTDGGLLVSSGPLNGCDVMTEPFPGFATDLQAQFMALMTQCQGASMITETIFENRFMHVSELCRMGANITVHRSSALVRGGYPLSGAPVMATDLRASVSLVLAALAAKGETIIDRIYHLDRGYADLEQKLSSCGACIERIR